MTHQQRVVVAVVVAYNRRALVLEALAALQAQTRPPDSILVIDNASTDGTAAAVEGVEGVDLRILARNTGGAGGFAVGIASAITSYDPEWIWLMDDDTIPTPTALDALLSVVDTAPDDTDLLGSRVVWTDGADHPMNTPRPNPFARSGRRAEAARADSVDIRSSSFVSMLIRADAVHRAGLPLADYFIWNDDFEYSARLIRGRRGLLVPHSVVVHKTKVRGSTDADPGPRFFYEVRNKLWLMRYSRALSIGEKLVYGASSVQRWTRTIWLSSDRGVLWDGLRRGLVDGARRGPRANPDVLSRLDGASSAVEVIEAGRAR